MNSNDNLMSVLEKIITHLERTKESSISEMTHAVEELDRNRLSGFLRACEELHIVESTGKASHRRYRLKANYLQKIKHLQVRRTQISRSNETRNYWHFPHRTRLKQRQIEWSTDIPGSIKS